MSLRPLALGICLSMVVCFALLSSAAAQEGHQAGSIPSEPAVVGPTDYPAGINPLTGLFVENSALLERRPLIVKVSNYPPFVRPQSGLMAADIVWEHLLAGGVTRFSAIFLSADVERVGPIRSLRLVDFELVRIYRGLSVYSGMAQGTLDVLRTDALMSRRIVGGVDPCPALCRYPREGVALEHTLYGDTAALRQLAVERGRDTTPEAITGMAFSAGVPLGGSPVTRVGVRYTQTQIGWTYDPGAERWLRSQDGEPHLDADSGAQISAANVLIIEDAHTIQPQVSPGYWGPGDFAFSVNLIGSGRIYLLRDGQYFLGQWQRATRAHPLTFHGLNGALLPFRPGNTFFTLVPRWVDGYSLAFDLPDAPTAAVIGSVGVSMRLGPGEGYITPDVAYPGDTFTLIGRNNQATWLEGRTADGRVVWLPRQALNVSDYDAMRLPSTRPSNER